MQPSEQPGEPKAASRREALLGGGDLARGESVAQRIDRNWSELLQELRVTQTGIQILFGFLLTLPFQARFAGLSGAQRVIYLLVVAFITVSTVCNLTPVVAHRFLFRRRVKDVLLNVSDRLALVSLASLALALLGAVGLVVDVIAGRTGALIGAGALAVLVVALWVVVPLLILRNRNRERY